MKSPILWALLWTLSIAVCPEGGAAQPKPNVLLVCVDDLKPLLGCYGSATVKTPNIDRLAKSGVLFQKAYCNQAVCAPSRNSLMTGLRPSTLGVYDLPTFFRKAKPDAVTLGQTFQKAGYHAEAMGKIFHVGHGNHDDTATWSVPHWSPKAEMYQLPSNRPPAQVAGKGKKKKQGGGGERGAAVEKADVNDSTYGDWQIAHEAIQRLKAARERKNQPFFMAVGFLKPHLPFVAPTKYWDLYKRETFRPEINQLPPKGAPEFAPTSWAELRNYSDIPNVGPLSPEQQRALIHGYHAAVSYMDAQLGRVLDALDSLGLTSNTIIVFWGDHGWHLGDHGMWCKHTNYEEATHIPLIVSVPGQSAGAKAAGLVETVDIYPTLCELAAVPAPAGLDGKSFASLIKNPAGAGKSAVFHVYPRSYQGKNLLGRAVRTAKYRLVEWKESGGETSGFEPVYELYNYESDPGETLNRAQVEPQVVADLMKLLRQQGEAKPQWNAAR